MQFSGQQFIGYRRSTDSASTFQALNPATGQPLLGYFHQASSREVDEAMQLAAKAFEGYKNIPGATKAAFLQAIADEILALGDALIQRAMSETALPQARLEGERGRTTMQLRLFASHILKDDWLDRRHDAHDVAWLIRHAPTGRLADEIRRSEATRPDLVAEVRARLRDHFADPDHRGVTHYVREAFDHRGEDDHESDRHAVATAVQRLLAALAQ